MDSLLRQSIDAARIRWSDWRRNAHLWGRDTALEVVEHAAALDRCLEAAAAECERLGDVVTALEDSATDGAIEMNALREALAEIVSPPDASRGEGYGCLDLHEARTIAREAIAE